MTKKRTYTDEELTAWLDGESAFASGQDIEAAVSLDAELSKRVDSLKIDLRGMRSAFDEVLDEAPAPPDLRASPAKSSPPGSRFAGLRAAAAVLAIAAAGAVGYGFADKQDTSWRGYVAAYQALYIPETLAEVERSPTERSEELSRVADAIGKPIDLTALTGVDALDFRRAQVLGFEGRPLAQLAFLSNAGDPVALCIIRSENTAESGTAFREMERMSAASWASDGYEYLLIGGDDDALIARAAAEFVGRI